MKTAKINTNINKIEGGEYDMVIKHIELYVKVNELPQIITKEEAEDIATTYAEEVQLDYYDKYLRYDYYTSQDPGEREALKEVYQDAYKEAYTILEKQYEIR